jgi:hypothetical protein
MAQLEHVPEQHDAVDVGERAEQRRPQLRPSQ